MKATVDIPEDLYRRVKAKSAIQGRLVREVVIALFQGWIAEANEQPATSSAPTVGGTTPSWFGAARSYARRLEHHDLTAIRRSIAMGRAHKGGSGKRGR